MQQAVSIVQQEQPSREDLDVDLFSENLADQILRDALADSCRRHSADSIVVMDTLRGNSFSHFIRNVAEQHTASAGLYLLIFFSEPGKPDMWTHEMKRFVIF